MDDQQIIELEAKLAYQEVLLNQMSDELYQQQQQIERLDGRYSRLLERLQALEAAPEGAPIGDEQPPPPHY